MHTKSFVSGLAGLTLALTGCESATQFLAMNEPVIPQGEFESSDGPKTSPLEREHHRAELKTREDKEKTAKKDVVEVPIAASPNQVDVVLRTALPDSFALDGKLDEWGTVCDKPGDPEASKRMAAPSCVTATLLADKVVLAGRFSGGGKDGISFGVAFGPESPMPVATVKEGGMIHEVACDDVDGREADKAVCAKLDALRAYVQQATRRVYRITDKGVGVISPDNNSVAMLGDVDFKITKDGEVQSFEAILPLKELPRSAEVQNKHVHAMASVRVEGKVRFADGGLTQGISFEPLSSARRAAMTSIENGQGMALYQPGSDELEVLSRDKTGMVVSQKRPLFKAEIAGDGTEIGYVPGLPHDLLAVRTKSTGQVVTKTLNHSGVELFPIGMAKRGNDVHVAFMGTSCSSEDSGPCDAGLSVQVLDKDGQLTAAMIDGEVPEAITFSKVAAFHEGPWSSFGLRGGAITSHAHESPVELRFAWDEKKKAYKVATTGLFVH